MSNNVYIVFEGQTFKIPKENAVQALQLPGARFETEKERTAREYGGAGYNAAAWAASIARGATFHLSDLILTGAGVEGKHLRKLKEAQPVASIAGEVAGVIAPALLTKQVKGAKYTPAGAVSRLGRGIFEGVEARLLRLFGDPKAPSLVGRVAAKGSAGAAAGFVEGSLYMGGASLGERALGEHESVAEAVSANAPMALLGAGIGGGISAGLAPIGHVASKLAPKIDAKLAALSGRKAEDLADRADHMIFKALGVEPGSPAHLKLQDKGYAEDAIRYLMQQDGVPGLTDGGIIRGQDRRIKHTYERLQRALFGKDGIGAELEKMYRRADGLQEEAVTKISEKQTAARGLMGNQAVYAVRQIAEEADALGIDVSAGVARPRAQAFQPGKVMDDIAREIKRLENEGLDSLNRGAVNRLNALGRDINNWGQELHLTDAYGKIKRLDEVARAARNANKPTKESAAKFIADAARKELYRATDEALNSGFGAHLSTRHKELNKMYRSLIGLHDAAKKSAFKELPEGFLAKLLKDFKDYGIRAAIWRLPMFMYGGVAKGLGYAAGIGGIRAGMGAFGRHPAAVATAAHARRLAVLRAMQESVEQVQTRAQRAVTKFSRLGQTAIVTAPLASSAIFKNVKGKTQGQKAQRLASSLQDLSSNPSYLADTMAAGLATIEEFAPNVAQAMGQKTVQALNLAIQTMPRPQWENPLQPQLDIGREWSDSESATFARNLSAIFYPMEVVENDLASGTLTATQAQLMALAWPKLHQQVSEYLREWAASTDKPLTSTQKQQLAVFLSEPPDGTYTDGFLRRQLAVYQPPAAGKGPQGSSLEALHKKDRSSRGHLSGFDRLEAGV